MKIIWSPRSEVELDKISEYLLSKWGQKVLEEFLNLIEDKVKAIATKPAQFPLLIKSKGIRKCVIRPQVSIFHWVRNGVIETLSVWGNAWDPEYLDL